MKKWVLAGLLAVSLLACKKEDDDYVGTEIMLVASRITKVYPPREFMSTCYYVKQRSDTDWKYFSIYDLEGFEHEEGYECLIEMKVYSNFSDHEPIMDIAKYRYVLKRIISRIKKDSEGLPPY